jgi:hypothetical protein
MHTPAIVSVLLCLSLGACGGGGGGGGGNNTPVQVTGRVTFDQVPFHPGAGMGLDYNSITQAPVRGARVEAIDVVGQAPLATTDTDANGNYTLTLPGGRNPFIRVKAQMERAGTPSWNFRVLNNTNGDALYALDSARFSTNSAQTINLNATSGWNGTQYVAANRNSGPFSILDVIFDAFQLVLGASPNASFPSLDIRWSADNFAGQGLDPASGDIGTTFYLSESFLGFTTGIYVLGHADDDSDEFDQHVIAHEWGHYFQDKFSRDESVGGAHGPGDVLDMRVAFSEGWGNAFSGMAMNDPVYRDSFGASQASDFDIDVENDDAIPAGWYSEASIQALFFDLFDSTNDVADSDTLALGFQPIFDAMNGPIRTTDALTSIFAFITPLKASLPASAASIDALVQAQAIDSVTMDAFGSTETHNGGEAANLPIYRPGTIGGSQQVCSSTLNDDFNHLGGRRFILFSVANTQQVSFLAQGPVGSDPDLILFHQGELFRSEDDSTGDGKEQFALQLAAGQYVLEAYDTSAIDENAGTTPQCFNLTISSP